MDDIIPPYTGLSYVIPDPDTFISTHFRWREALWLPSWGRLANDTDGLSQNILTNLSLTFQKLETVREWAQQFSVGSSADIPINVHCAYRPLLYNEEVKGAPGSAHMTGQAVDCDIGGEELVPVFIKRALDNNLLDKLSLRMEQGTTTWIHFDTRAPGPSGRYFQP